VVAVGVTVTAVPLTAAIFPGVITPVPPEKAPVRVALCPSVMVDGFATKLEMAAGGVVFPEPELDPPQPIKPVRQKLNAVVKTAKTESRLITFPLS
jgi:hypothetical protein